jgi:hypothetical protein
MNDDRPVYADLMLDIETLGTSHRSAVVSIGAVLFRLDTTDDLETIKDPERCFYAVLDTDDQLARGRITDSDTLDWWAEQSPEAQAVLRAPVEDVDSVLRRFMEFCRGIRRVWGNGNTFDNAIIRDLCDTYGAEYPVFYSQDLDFRTLKYLWRILTKWKRKNIEVRVGTHHNALADAQSQVLQAQEMYREVKGTRYGI